MFRFANPEFLYLLLILPALIVFYIYAVIQKLGGFLPVLQLSETESDPQVWRPGANGTVDAGCI